MGDQVLAKYQVKWLSNHTYQLYPFDKNNQVNYDLYMLVNIYEIDGDTYKTVAKASFDDNFYREGVSKKIGPPEIRIKSDL